MSYELPDDITAGQAIRFRQLLRDLRLDEVFSSSADEEADEAPSIGETRRLSDVAEEAEPQEEVTVSIDVAAFEDALYHDERVLDAAQVFFGVSRAEAEDVPLSAIRRGFVHFAEESQGLSSAALGSVGSLA